MAQRIIDGLCGIAWFVFVILTALQVFLRYVLNSSLYWSDELARFCLIWFIFLGVIIITTENDHIKVGIYVNRFKYGRPKAFFALIENIVAISYSGFLLYGSWTLLPLSRHTMSPALRMPIVFWYLAATTASAAILVLSLKRASSNLISLLHGPSDIN